MCSAELQNPGWIWSLQTCDPDTGQLSDFCSHQGHHKTDNQRVLQMFRDIFGYIGTPHFYILKTEIFPLPVTEITFYCYDEQMNIVFELWFYSKCPLYTTSNRCIFNFWSVLFQKKNLKIFHPALSVGWFSMPFLKKKNHYKLQPVDLILHNLAIILNPHKECSETRLTGKCIILMGPKFLPWGCP